MSDVIYPSPLRRFNLPLLLGILLLILLQPLLWSPPAVLQAKLFDQQHYTIIHLSLELLSVFVFAACVAILLQPLPRPRLCYRNIVIAGFTAVAVLDYLHAITYAGMPAFFTVSSTGKSFLFWLTARLAGLLTFVLLALGAQLPGSRLFWLLTGFAVSGGCFIAGTWFPDQLPVVFSSTATAILFKQKAEILLFTGFAMVTAIFLSRYWRRPRVRHLSFAAATGAMALAALTQTGWFGNTDLTVLLGHLLKISATVLIYKAIFQAELLRPYLRLQRAEQEKQQALNTSQQLRTALDEHAIVAFTDARGVISCVNDKFCQISGYSRDELIGQTHKVINSGYHAPGFFRDMWQQIRQGRFWHGEVCNRAKDGSIYWVNTTIVPVTDNDGSVLQYIAIRADITERKLAEQEARRLALYDDLTGLPNRRLLKDKLQQLGQTGSEAGLHALLLLDLDNFKEINDSFGHAIGDELLKQVAERLCQFSGDIDQCARLGGDEFIVLLNLSADSAQAFVSGVRQQAEQMRAMLAEPYQLSGKYVSTSVSVGISMFSNLPDSTDDALKQADLALYQSKAHGRNCVTFFEPQLQLEIDRRNDTLRALKQAISRQQLSLHFQPIMDGFSRMKGAEALLRWQHPLLGQVPPSVFIPLAEQSSLILDIGQWVLEQSCAQLALWQQQPLSRDWTMAVNVSARQLQQTDFVATVLALLKRYQIPGHCLQFELTETLLQQNIQQTTVVMQQLQAHGVRFALDDFGTGYSSLNYLTKLPINVLKIDRTFVENMLNGPEDACVVQTILSLARSLSLDVVAEGVETKQQMLFLLQQNCRYFQGYHFARPMPAAALQAFADNQDNLQS